MTAAELRKLGARWERARLAEERARMERDTAIIAALRDGQMSQREIAEHAWVSHGRVGQLAQNLKTNLKTKEIT